MEVEIQVAEEGGENRQGEGKEEESGEKKEECGRMRECGGRRRPLEIRAGRRGRKVFFCFF